MSSLNMKTVHLSDIEYQPSMFEVTKTEHKIEIISDFIMKAAEQSKATSLIVTSMSIKEMFKKLNISYSAAAPSLVKKAIEPSKNNAFSSSITMYGVGYLVVFKSSPSSRLFKESPKTYTTSENSSSFNKLVNVLIDTKTDERITILKEDERTQEQDEKHPFE